MRSERAFCNGTRDPRPRRCSTRYLTRHARYSKPEFLETIDNYGLLCLDLAWNYFKLKDPAFLTEAYARLTKASESFKRLRGDNMERMIQNDELCPELVMFVRLHLLNAIFAYHTGDTSGSVQWLKRVEQEIHRTSLVRVCRWRWKLCDPLARIHR